MVDTSAIEAGCGVAAVALTVGGAILRSLARLRSEIKQSLAQAIGLQADWSDEIDARVETIEDGINDHEVRISRLEIHQGFPIAQPPRVKARRKTPRRIEAMAEGVDVPPRKAQPPVISDEGIIPADDD